MRKLVSILLFLAMILPFATQAQTTTPATMPYSCNFEDDTENANWTFVNGTSTNKFFIGTADNNGGAKSLYISNSTDGSTAGYSTGNTSYAYAYREITVTSSSFTFSFDWKCSGEASSYGNSMYDYGRVFLTPANATIEGYNGSSTSTITGLSYNSTPSGWIDVDNNSAFVNQSSWQTFTSEEIVLSAGTYKLVYFWKNDYSGGNNPPFTIDNISVQEVSCPRPGGIHLSNISSTTATIAWTADDITSFNYECVSEGSSRTYNSISTTNTEVTLTDLSPNTSYTFYIQALCGTDATAWSTITFRTNCTPYALSSLPLSENFNSWNNINYDPCYKSGSTVSGHPYPMISSYSGVQSTKAVELYAPLSGYCWFALPAFEVDLNQLQVSFDCNIYSYKIILGAMSNPNDITTLDTLAIFDNNDGEYHSYTLPLSIYQGTNKHLAFVVHGDGSNRGDVYLDNLLIDALPACPDPINFAAVATGSETAVITYIATSDIASYILEYDTTGYTRGNVNAMQDLSTAGDTIFITGLTPNTSYDFYMRSDCGGDTGNWIGPITIRTACAPVAESELPYIESFDTWENINSNPCYGMPGEYPQPSISTTHFMDGTKSFYMGSSYAKMWLSMPAFTAEIGSLQISFSMKRNGSNDYPVLVGLTDDPTGLSMFDTVATVRCYTNTWERKSVTLTSYQGTGKYITIVSPTGSYNYIDSIVVEYAYFCSDPINFSATVISSSEAKIYFTNTGTQGVDVIYGLHGFDLANGTTVTSTTDSIVIDNLVGNTLYDFYIRANCGYESGNWIGPLSVRTNCPEFVDISDNPFIEDFDSYTTGISSNSSAPSSYPNHTMPQCWYFLNMTNGPQVFISSNEYATSGNCMFLRSSRTPLFITLPKFNESLDLIRVAFSTRFEEEDDGVLILGVMTNPNVDTTFIPLDTVANSTSKVRHEYLLDQYELYGTEYHITFRYIDDQETVWYLGIDSIVVDLAPTCKRPMHIAAIDSTITTTSAQISWTSTATNWIVEYGPEGFTAGTGNMVVTNTNPFTLTGLDHSTRYDVYVRAICGNDTSEYPVAAGTFQTACDVVTELPWVANLDGHYNVYRHTNTNNAAPTCWELINRGETSSWRYSESASDVRSGRALYFYGSPYSSTVNDDWLITPELQLTGNEQITFWMRNTSNAASNEYSANMKLYYYIVDANIDTLNTASFIQIGDSIRRSGADADQWEEYIIPLTDLSGNVRLAFVVNTSSYTFCIDDVSVEAMPSCGRPRDVVFSNIQSSQVDVAWTGTGDTYTIAYGISGFSINDASAYQTTTSNTNSVTLTGLLANTNYDVYVAANCSNPTATSQWSYVETVRTACGAVAIPFSEDFNSYTNVTTGTSAPTTYPNHDMPTCWNFLNMSVDNYPKVFMSSYSGYNVSGNSLFFLSKANTSVYAVLPPMDAAIDSLRINFTYRNEGISGSNGILSLGVMTNPNDANSFIEVETFEQISTLTSVTHDFWVDSIFGTGYQIAFRYTGGSNSNYYLSIDNVSVEYAPTCRVSDNLTVSNITSNSADLSWLNGSGNSYIVAYSTDRNFNPDTCTTVLESTTENATISNLQSFSSYYYAVKTICDGDSSEWSTISNFKTTLDCGTNTYEEVELTRGTSSASALPMYAAANYYPKAKSWQIVTTQELEMEGMYAGNIYSVGFQYDAGTPISPNIKIYIANTTLNTMSTADTLGPNQMTLVYEGTATFSNASTWSVIDFNTPFAYTGGNIMIAVERTANISNSGSFKYDAGQAGVNRTVYKVDGSWSGSSIYTTTHRNNLKFSGCTTIPTCPRPSNVTISNIQPTQVDIAWTSNGTTFNIAYGPHGFSMDSVNAYQITNSTTNNVTLSGLTEGMRYDVYVRAICSTTETSNWSYMSTFVTTCSPVSVPYSENFNGYTENVSTNNSAHSSYPYHSLPSCWTFINMSDNAGAQPQAFLSSSSTYSADNSNILILSSEYGKTIYAALPKFNEPISSLYLSMKYRTYSANESYNGKPEIGVMTDLSDTSTFVLLETYPTSTTYTTAEHYFVIDSLQGNDYNIVIRYKATPDGYYSYSAMFDDIVVDYTPSCIRPLNPAVSNIGQTSVDLSWRNANAVSNFAVEYKKATDTVWTTISGITTTSTTISNLSPSTEYNFRIKSICSASDESRYSDIVSATTLCGAIQLPFTEDFSNSDFPYNCWTKFKDSYTNPIAYASSGWQHTTTPNGLSTGHLKFNIYSTYTYGFATPEIDLTQVADAELTFDLALTKYNYPDVPATSSDDRFIVIVSLDGGATWADTNAIIWGHDSTCAYNYNSITNTGITPTISLNRFVGNVVKIAFWGSSTTSGSSDNDLHIDNISVVALSSCAAPVISGVVPSHNNAVVSWTSSATDFQVVYKEANATEWADTIDVTNATSYTISGLTHETNYIVAVRALCGAENSDWTEASFTTTELLCLAPTNVTAANITYTSATISWEAAENQSEWTVEYGYGENTLSVTTTTTSVDLTDLYAGMAYTVRVQGRCSEDVVSDWSEVYTFNTQACVTVSDVTVNEIGGTNATITWTPAEGQTAWEITYGMQGFSEGNGIATISVTTTTYQITGLEPSMSYDVYVRAICQEGVYSAWSERVTFTTTEEECNPVSNVTANDITESGATITWTAADNETKWQVAYCLASDATVVGEDATIVDVENTPSYTITGLESRTSYDAFVRTVCSENNYSAWTKVNFTTEGIGINTAANDNVSVSIYPNPANTQATISVEGINGKVEFVVADMNGRMIVIETINCNGQLVKTIDVSNLAKGAYFVHIYNDNFNTTRKLIVK